MNKDLGVGSKVKAYDRYRFTSKPVVGRILELSKTNDGVKVVILEETQSPVKYPIGSETWFSIHQVKSYDEPLEVIGGMQLNEYLVLSEVTERKFPDGLHLNPEQAELLHHSMGVVTEAGELMDQMKRHLIYGKDIDSTNLIEELGDLAWYVAGFMRLINTRQEWASHDDELQSVIFKKNIDKLRERFGEKFDAHRALNRNLVKEREVLEEPESLLVEDNLITEEALGFYYTKGPNKYGPYSSRDVCQVALDKHMRSS